MFTLSGNVVTPNPAILLLDPFKKIWERDKSKDKGTAIKEFAYVFFMVSPLVDNPYSGYEEEVREQKIQDSLFDKKYRPDELVKAAMEEYEDYLSNGSVAIRLYKANIRHVESIIDYLNTVDYNERTKSEGLVHNIDRNKKIAEESSKLLEGLKKLEHQIYQEDYQDEKIKAGRRISQFER